MKTNTASNAKLQYEAGQDISAMAAMTDSGSITGVQRPASGKSGYEPKIYPDGLAPAAKSRLPPYLSAKI